MNVTFLDTGFSTAPERVLIQGGSSRPVECHGLVALIEHPREGLVLWDTGFAPRLYTATTRLPWRAFRWMAPFFTTPDLAGVTQLRARGINAGDVRQVIISHLHPDHVAGLGDFPRATITLAGEALDLALGVRGLAAFRGGVYPMLLPADLAHRARPIDSFTGPDLPHLGPTHDLFGDGALRLVPLPGHARGQIGLLVERDRGPLLLAADACWLSRSIRERRPPSRLANLLFDNPRLVRDTIDRLHRFSRARPDVEIVPTHCPEAFPKEERREKSEE